MTKTKEQYLHLSGELTSGFSILGVRDTSIAEDDFFDHGYTIPLYQSIPDLPYDDTGLEFLVLGNIGDGFTAYGPLECDDYGDLADTLDRQKITENWVVLTWE